MSEAVKAFGPSAIATPANAITMARLLAAPLFALFLAETGPSSWWLLVAWVLLSASDGLDGYIARWHGTTRSGAFLDPLADKFLVLGALCALAGIGVFGWLPVALIAAREVVMSAFRVSAGRRGISVPATPMAKLKTVFQDLAVFLAILPTSHRAHTAIETVLWVAVALTVLSGVEYWREARRRDREIGTSIATVAKQPTS